MESGPYGLERNPSIHTSIPLGHFATSTSRPQGQRASRRGPQCGPRYFLR